jgi:hypothetical protein
MSRRKPPNRGGRPMKLTPEVIAKLAIGFRNWGSPGPAARNSGIARATCWRWVRQARAGDPRLSWLLPLLPKVKEPDPDESSDLLAPNLNG